MRKLIILILTVLLSTAMFSTIALITLNSTDPLVWNIQERLIDLNYYAFNSTGTLGSMTRQSLINFQSENGLMADGSAGDETLIKLFGNDAVRAPITGKIPIGPSIASGTKPTLFGESTDWSSSIESKFVLNKDYQVTDQITQKTFNIQRVGGKNHAKIEVSSGSDHSTFLEIFGGEYNWSKRSVIVNIDGASIAASLQGWPSGDDIISSNGMNGTCALYFMGSASDISGLLDAEHHASVLKASDEKHW